MNTQESSCSSSSDIDYFPLFRETDLICKFDRITVEVPEDCLYFVICDDCKTPDIPETLAGLWEEEEKFAMKTDFECPLEALLILDPLKFESLTFGPLG